MEVMLEIVAALYERRFRRSQTAATAPIAVGATCLWKPSATTFNLNLLNGPSPANVLKQYTWSSPGTNGTPFAIQVSTNLTDWQTLTGVTNNGWGITYMETVTNAARYFRTVPQ